MKNDIRTAILKAANHIEANPGDFSFASVVVPECGTPGCALGWIAAFRGHRTHVPDGDRACFNLEGFPTGVDDMDFYNRMDDLGVPDWSRSAEACAQALRAYADRWHPAPTQQPPDWQ